MQDSYTTGAIIGLAIIAAFAASDAWWRRRHRRRLARAKVVGDRLLGGGPPAQSVAVAVRRTGWDWLYEKMFPAAYYPVDFSDPRTFIRTEVRTRLCVSDRLRLLLTGDLRVLITTYTDVEVKECRAHSNIEVQPFKEV